jgi:hypothetical protein
MRKRKKYCGFKYKKIKANHARRPIPSAPLGQGLCGPAVSSTLVSLPMDAMGQINRCFTLKIERQMLHRHLACLLGNNDVSVELPEAAWVKDATSGSFDFTSLLGSLRAAQDGQGK